MKKILLLFYPFFLYSQSVYLPVTHPVYKYLDKMEAKLIVVGYRDAIRPISREAIATFIIQIDTTSQTLTEVEQEEQFFYKEEFFQELENLGYENIIEERWHLYQYKSNPANVNIDMIGGVTYRDRADNSFTKVISNGLHAYGYVGKSAGAYFMYRDNSLAGSYRSSSNPLSSDLAQVTGIIGSSIYYDPVEVQVNATFGFVTLSAEKMHNVWGAGEQGNVILSNKAPSYPQIKLRANLGENVDFTYIHGWLFSDILDSARSYQSSTVPGGLGFRRVDRQKYIAAHMLEFTPWNGVDLAIGESEVYGGRSPELLYLIPVMFFKAGEHWMKDLDNSQMFFSADLNVIKNQNYYFSLFIDEISTDDFAKADRQHNQLAFTVGMNVYDLIFHDTKLMVEYTRLNPWVYNHRFSDDTYQSHRINLGHWLGQNADVFSVGVTHRPFRNLELGLYFESLRKGGKDSTIFQYRLPTPTILYGPITKQQTLGIVGTYEPTRDLIIDFRMLLTRFTTQVTVSSYSYQNNPNEYVISSDYAKKWDIFVGIRYNFD